MLLFYRNILGGTYGHHFSPSCYHSSWNPAPGFNIAFNHRCQKGYICFVRAPSTLPSPTGAAAEEAWGWSRLFSLGKKKKTCIVFNVDKAYGTKRSVCYRTHSQSPQGLFLFSNRGMCQLRPADCLPPELNHAQISSSSMERYWVGAEQVEAVSTFLTDRQRPN